MTTSDDFKAQLRAGKIVDALTLVLSQAVELEIITWVSSSNSDANTLAEIDQPPVNSRMRTRLNIVEGEIDNEIGSEFVGNGLYTELRQFHMEQVQASSQIIQQNLENLQQLFTVLSSTIVQLPRASHRLVIDSNPVLSSSQDHLS